MSFPLSPSDLQQTSPAAAQTQEVSAVHEEAIQQARADFNFFAALSDPLEFIFRFPLFYLQLFQMLTAFTKKVERFAIGIPRGFAKTTFIKLLCLWYILFSQKKFILIVGAAEGLAANTLADIWDLLRSDNIRGLFGDCTLSMEADTQTLKVFYFRGRSVIIRAIGAGTAVRGINRKNSRPDVIIMDDIQTREDSENQEISDKLFKWVLGTLSKARSNFGCTYIYIGNMYPTNCILEKLRLNSQWVSLIVGGILADGTSLWEELRPLEELLEEYQSDTEAGHPEIFITEVLNSTEIAAKSGIDISKIPVLPSYIDLEEADGSFILIDPSSGKKQGDDCTINHFSIVDAVPILDTVEAGTFTPLEVIEIAIGLGMKKGTRVIGVEGGAYQSTLLFWFNHYCNLHGISGFEFIELSPKSRNKNTRIKGGLVKLLKGEIKLFPTVRSRVLAQIVDWNPLTSNNTDDIIDPIGYVEEFMQEHGHLCTKLLLEMEEDIPAATHYGSSIEESL